MMFQKGDIVRIKTEKANKYIRAGAPARIMKGLFIILEKLNEDESYDYHVESLQNKGDRYYFIEDILISNNRLILRKDLFTI